MDFLHSILIKPFQDMVGAPDFLLQVLWEGFVSGVLYALIALGFVLIYKSSRIFNFAQGIMVVFAALTLVGLHEKGVPAWLALPLTLGVMYLLAMSIERVVLRPLVNQPDIILFMATIGITLFLIGFGEIIFGGENKVMITEQLFIPTGSFTFEPFGGFVSDRSAEDRHLTAVVIAVAPGRRRWRSSSTARRWAAPSARSATITRRRCRSASRSPPSGCWSGSSPASSRWPPASSGAHAPDVSFALEVIAYKALPVLILGGFTSIPGAIVGGLIIGIGEKLFEIYWGQPLLGGNTETWFAFVLALIVLLFRPQGLFGEKIIERV